jgi:hypothetical protein
MTIDEKLEILHDSIKSLEKVAVAHRATIEARELQTEGHDHRIKALLAIIEENNRS